MENSKCHQDPHLPSVRPSQDLITQGVSYLQVFLCLEFSAKKQLPISLTYIYWGSRVTLGTGAPPDTPCDDKYMLTE